MKKLKQKNSTTGRAQNTGKSNFLKKTLVVFAFLAFAGFGFRAQAQQTIKLAVNNTAAPGCDWVVDLLDASSTSIFSFPSAGSSGVTSPPGACPTYAGTVASVRVSRGPCSVSFLVTGSPPWIPMTVYSPPCIGACSPSIQGSGVSANSICGTSTSDWVIVIGIN